VTLTEGQAALLLAEGWGFETTKDGATVVFDSAIEPRPLMLPKPVCLVEGCMNVVMDNQTQVCRGHFRKRDRLVRFKERAS
jgi:hypothetical protein